MTLYAVLNNTDRLRVLPNNTCEKNRKALHLTKIRPQCQQEITLSQWLANLMEVHRKCTSIKFADL